MLKNESIEINIKQHARQYLLERRFLFQGIHIKHLQQALKLNINRLSYYLITEYNKSMKLTCIEILLMRSLLLPTNITG